MITRVGGTPEPKIPDRTLLDHLRAVNVNPRKDLDHRFYALYPSNGSELRRAVMLVGRFKPDAIQRYLAQELKGTQRLASGHVTYKIAFSVPEITASAGGAWSFELSPLSAYTRAEVLLAGD